MEKIVFENAPSTKTPISAEFLNKLQDNIRDGIYPIGSIFLSVSNVNPSTYFGGEWEQIKGRFLLGCGTNEANNTNKFGDLAEGFTTINAGEMGGKYVHTLSIDEMPAHEHKVMYGNYGEATLTADISRGLVGENTNQDGSNTRATGGNQPHTNMPPYLGVYMWKRIA